MTKFKKKNKLSLDDRILNSKFDYCKNLKWFLIAPIIVCLIGLVLLCTVGFNLGIDFTGGSNMTIYIDSEGTYTQSSLDINKDRNEIEEKINKVLGLHNLSVTTLQETTINSADLGIENGKAIIVKYQNDNSLKSSEIEEINETIRLQILKEFGFVAETTQIEDLDDLPEAVLVSNGGVTTASASAELMMKSFIALLVAIVLILIYVAIRFEFTSGLAAILTLFHDILVTASIVLVCRIQINVAFIAALITILGYSINNTIIIFDRMRDDLKIARNTNAKISNKQVANSAVSSMMLRSILTTITTFIMIFMITVIGVADIREFAFPIMVGIIAGFYSSVFITPGLWAIAYKPKKKKKSQPTASSKPKSEEIVIE